jgi:hypothetical protein
MKEISLLLSDVAFWAPVGIALVLLLASLQPGEAAGDASPPAPCNLDRAPVRSFAWPQRNRRPFQRLQAALSASYAARLEQASKAIRLVPPSRARPTDPAAD